MDLSRTEAVLVELGAGSRSALREVIWRTGIRRIVQMDEMPSPKSEEFLNADVILIGADGPGPESLSLIRQIRQSASTANPFAFVFATHFEPTREAITGALEAGVDMILGKPLSTAVLHQRMGVQMASARKWMVSSNYIGPERPAGPGSGQGTRLAAPHLLQMKAAGARVEDIRAAVESTKAQVVQQRKLHLAYQTAFVVARAEVAPTDPAALAELKQLRPMIQELLPQIEDPDRRFEAQIAADELLARLSHLSSGAEANAMSYGPAVALAAQVFCLSVGRGQVERAVTEIRAAAKMLHGR
jgi:DNA-binding response OmpR family regulator